MQPTDTKTKFSDLGLNPSIVTAVNEKGYESPSPIQAKAIPAVLDGKDVMAAAQTGTGKTAGFTLPILHLLEQGQPAKANQVRALILTPTRELAAQVADNVNTYGRDLPLRSQVVFGGVKVNPQMMELRGGADILIATPGRLLDLHQQNAVKFKDLEILVLDEADRMLDMGFIRDIRKILALLPKQRQNLLFSATFSDEIRDLAKGLAHNPVEISVTPPNTTANTVEQWIYPLDKNRKGEALVTLIKDNDWRQVLVFTKTKHGANKLTKQLDSQGIKAAAIHGNKSQGARTRALADFKSGEINILVATDIAARGLDISQLPQVVNYDLPNVPEDYIHRIGRTGRAGANGHALSLVCLEDFKLLQDIERLLQKLIDRRDLEGFLPINDLPESKLKAPARPKKPKKKTSKKSNHRDGQRSGENARGHKPASKNPHHKTKRKSSGNKTGNKTGNDPYARSKSKRRSSAKGKSNQRSGNR